MEVPEFCTRARTRVLRKRKTEQEADPDYCPEGSNLSKGVDGEPEPSSSVTIGNGNGNPTTPSSSDMMALGATGLTLPQEKKLKAWEERRVVRRSKKLLEDRLKPKPEMNYIERDQYSIEDCNTKAGQVRKARAAQVKRARMLAKLEKKKEKAKNKKGKKGATEDDDNEEDDDDSFDYSQLDPIARELDPYALYLEQQEETVDMENFRLDALPKFVMGTGKGTKGGPPAFEYKSLWNYELEPLKVEDTEEDIKKKEPWEEKDPTVPDMKPEILSVVASFTLGRPLDLKYIAHRTRNVEYNPDRFAPLIMRIRTPKTTGLIFSSGRIIVTGTKSELECKLASRKYARIIEKLGFKVKVLNFDIQNISASCNLKFRVKLNHLSNNQLYGKLSYEPELFPGLVIPLEYPRVKVIIFCTGSVLMTGAKSEADLEQALKTVYPLVKLYAP